MDHGKSLRKCIFAWKLKPKLRLFSGSFTPFNRLPVSVSRPTTNPSWRLPCSWTGCAWSLSPWCGCLSCTAWLPLRPPSTRPSATSARNAPSSGSGRWSRTAAVQHGTGASVRGENICAKQLRVNRSGLEPLGWHRSSLEHVSPFHIDVFSVPGKCSLNTLQRAFHF